MRIIVLLGLIFAVYLPAVRGQDDLVKRAFERAASLEESSAIYHLARDYVLRAGDEVTPFLREQSESEEVGRRWLARSILQELKRPAFVKRWSGVLREIDVVPDATDPTVLLAAPKRRFVWDEVKGSVADVTALERCGLKAGDRIPMDLLALAIDGLRKTTPHSVTYDLDDWAFGSNDIRSTFYHVLAKRASEKDSFALLIDFSWIDLESFKEAAKRIGDPLLPYLPEFETKHLNQKQHQNSRRIRHLGLAAIGSETSLNLLLTEYAGTGEFIPIPSSIPPSLVRSYLEMENGGGHWEFRHALVASGDKILAALDDVARGGSERTRAIAAGVAFEIRNPDATAAAYKLVADGTPWMVRGGAATEKVARPKFSWQRSGRLINIARPINLARYFWNQNQTISLVPSLADQLPTELLAEFRQIFTTRDGQSPSIIKLEAEMEVMPPTEAELHQFATDPIVKARRLLAAGERGARAVIEVADGDPVMIALAETIRIRQRNPELFETYVAAMSMPLPLVPRHEVVALDTYRQAGGILKSLFGESAIPLLRASLVFPLGADGRRHNVLAAHGLAALEDLGSIEIIGMNHGRLGWRVDEILAEFGNAGMDYAKGVALENESDPEYGDSLHLVACRTLLRGSDPAAASKVLEGLENALGDDGEQPLAEKYVVLAGRCDDEGLVESLFALGAKYPKLAERVFYAVYKYDHPRSIEMFIERCREGYFSTLQIGLPHIEALVRESEREPDSKVRSHLVAKLGFHSFNPENLNEGKAVRRAGAKALLRFADSDADVDIRHVAANRLSWFGQVDPDLQSVVAPALIRYAKRGDREWQKFLGYLSSSKHRSVTDSLLELYRSNPQLHTGWASPIVPSDELSRNLISAMRQRLEANQQEGFSELNTISNPRFTGQGTKEIQKLLRDFSDRMEFRHAVYEALLPIGELDLFDEAVELLENLMSDQGMLVEDWSEKTQRLAIAIANADPERAYPVLAETVLRSGVSSTGVAGRIAELLTTNYQSEGGYIFRDE